MLNSQAEVPLEFRKAVQINCELGPGKVVRLVEITLAEEDCAVVPFESVHAPAV